MHFGQQVVAAQAVGQAQRQGDGGLVRAARKALLEGHAVDDDVAVAGLQQYARDAASCGGRRR